MSLLPNAGVLVPVPDSFDFDAQVLAPAPRDPTGRTLRMRNQHNLATEKFNEISVEQTLNCKEDRANYVDVGPPLKAFYAYTQDDMTDMIYSEQYCADVGPLPVFIRQQVNRSRRIRTERADTEKVEKKKVKGRPVHGSMVLSNPITRLPGQRAAVTIPNVIRHSMAEGLYIPLHWFSDERLQFIQHRLHDVPTKLFRPEPSLEFPSPDKVLVFDMPKMIPMATWGSDESSACLSPLKWQQAATNMEAALTIVSEVVPSNAPDKATYASEFRKHRLFFANYDRFEDNYADWYPFEREARHQILQGFIFDGDYYVRQVDGLLHAKQAAAVYGTSSARPQAFLGPGTRDAKSLKQHPAHAISFADGSACFTLLRQGELWTVKPFRGQDCKRICVEFNLPHGCQRTHDDAQANALSAHKRPSDHHRPGNSVNHRAADVIVLSVIRRVSSPRTQLLEILAPSLSSTSWYSPSHHAYAPVLVPHTSASSVGRAYFVVQLALERSVGSSPLPLGYSAEGFRRPRRLFHERSDEVSITPAFGDSRADEGVSGPEPVPQNDGFLRLWLATFAARAGFRIFLESVIPPVRYRPSHQLSFFDFRPRVADYSGV
ncbi:hypothetical protein B0H14DRAFT_3859813 [Mycena olivaceomarginata]|nr:hypothetical protein B0H14DRAFT_3859813 [Mycena olivaceomarginata]